MQNNSQERQERSPRSQPYARLTQQLLLCGTHHRVTTCLTSHTHTHTYWSDTFPLLRSHFLPHYSTCLHSRCSFKKRTLHFEASRICIPAARCCIWARWVGVQTAPRVHLRNKTKKKTLRSSQELVDPEKNNSTFELSWKQPVIWAICVQLDLPVLSSRCPVRCPCGGKEPCNIISRYA